MSIKELLKYYGPAGKVAQDKEELEVMPTEFPIFNDIVMGCGGLPVGRAIEIYGMESSGKSTLAQNFAAHIQRAGGTVAWFDAENAVVKSYMAGSGVNLEELFLPEFGYGEDMLYKVQLAIAIGFNLIIVDSIQAVIPEKLKDIPIEEISMKDKLMAAGMWTAFFNKIEGGFRVTDASGKLIETKHPVPILKTKETKSGIKKVIEEDNTIHRLSTSDCCLIFINHKKAKVGTPYQQYYTPGGTRKNFSFSARIDIYSAKKKMGTSGGDKVLKYRDVTLRASKNKVGPPYGEAKFKLYPNGIFEEVGGGHTGFQEEDSEDE